MAGGGAPATWNRKFEIMLEYISAVLYNIIKSQRKSKSIIFLTCIDRFV